MHLINSHLFQDTPSGDDILFTALIDKATTLGYTLPSANTLSALNTLIKDMRRIGMIQRLDLFHVYASDLGTTTPFRLMNICNAEMIGTTNGAITWSNNGSKGNANIEQQTNDNKGCINTNFNPYSGGYNFQQNNASVGCVVSEYNASKGTALMSLSSNSVDLRTTLPCSTGGTSHRLNVIDSANTTPAFPNFGTGLKMTSRISSVNVEAVSEHNYALLNSASSAIFNGTLNLHALTKNITTQGGAYALYFGGQGISCAFAGASIPYDMAQNFRQVYNKYLRTIGLQQVA